MINGTLADLPDIYPAERREALHRLSPSLMGNKPIDRGIWSDIDPTDAARIASGDAVAARHLVQFVGATELTKSTDRRAIWSPGISEADFRASSEIQRRAQLVAQFRSESRDEGTRKLGLTPLRWHLERHPDAPQLLIPRHSSKNYKYLPVAFGDADTVAGDSLMIIAEPTLVDFAALTSRHLQVWLHGIGGRIGAGDDPRFSNTLVWNTFPFPALDDDVQARIEAAAQGVLAVRAAHGCQSPWRPKQPGDHTLAELYHRARMPVDLADAHTTLDAAIDDVFVVPHDLSDNALLGALLERYQQAVAAESGATALSLIGVS